MTDKELKKLTRAELYELLLSQDRELRVLRQEGSEPTELEMAVTSLQRRQRFWKLLRSTVNTLITVAAVAVLIATLWLPVLQIYGTSMTPTLTEGSIVVSVKARELQPGDIIAFYYNNKILIKRLVATSGDWVDIDADGNVYVNNVLLEEPYLTERALGDCNIDLPYQVPEERVFVMGDHRSVSVDSRNTTVGCVAEEQVVGKLVFRVWPLSELGAVR